MSLSYLVGHKSPAKRICRILDLVKLFFGQSLQVLVPERAQRKNGFLWQTQIKVVIVEVVIAEAGPKSAVNRPTNSQALGSKRRLACNHRGYAPRTWYCVDVVIQSVLMLSTRK